MWDRSLECGVPQGSILATLSFVIYISQFTNSVRFCKCHFYADDSQIYKSFNVSDSVRASNEINEDLNNLYEFLVQHSLLINPNKSIVVIFGTNANVSKLRVLNVNIEISGTKLSIAESARSLGLNYGNKSSI